MEVKLKYMGYEGNSQTPFVYRILTANGHADEIRENIFTSQESIEMPDELWTEGSGWANMECEQCGWVYQERTRPGSVVTCPMCDYQEQIPDDAELEETNLDDWEYIDC